MSRPEFWVVWRCHGISCVQFRTNLKLEGKIELHHRYGNFFKSAVRRVTWSQIYSKSLLNDYEAYQQQHLKRYPVVLKNLRAWILIRANSFTKTPVNIMKRKPTKVFWNYHFKVIKYALQRILHQNRWYTSLIAICFFFSHTNLISNYNPVLIDVLDSFCHSLGHH